MKRSTLKNESRRSTPPPEGALRRVTTLVSHSLKLLLILMLTCLSALPAQADGPSVDDIVFSDNDININDNNNSDTIGAITVKFQYYNTSGADCGLPPKSNKFGSFLKINDKEVLEFWSFSGIDEPGQNQSKTGYCWLKTKITNNEYFSYVCIFDEKEKKDIQINTTETETKHKDPGGPGYVTIKMYLNNNGLKLASRPKGLEFEIDLNYDTNNVGPDYHLKKTQTFYFKYPTIPSITHTYSNNPGKYSISFDTERKNDYYDFFLPVSGKQSVQKAFETSISNHHQPLFYHYYYYYNKHVTLEYNYSQFSNQNYILPAYQRAENLKATDSVSAYSRKIILSWNISELSSDDPVIDNDEFEIQRSENKNFTKTTLVGQIKYNRNQTTYSIEDDISSNNFNGTYYYRVRRTATADKWGWNICDSTHVDISSRHRYIDPDSATAEMINNGTVRIKWNYDDGKIVTKDADVMLTRINERTGVNYTFAIPADSVANCRYEEKLPTSCDVYSYTIYVVPGSTEFRQQSPVAVRPVNDQALYVQEVGQVLSFNASKGYFSSHVELEWTSDGLPIEFFAIKAREYGSDDEFRQIDKVEANVASTQYSYSDTKSVPGLVYEYKIVAVTNCGNETTELEYPTNEIGFRTPTGDIYGRVTFENGQAVPDVEVRAEATDGTGVSGKAYSFSGYDKLQVANTKLLSNATAEATFEAWFKPDSEGTSNSDATLIEKGNMYALKYADNKLTFKVGTQEVSTESLADYTASSAFVHVSAVAAADSIIIYVNSDEAARTARTATVASDTTSAVTIGSLFTGVIDEVRLWSVALDSASVVRDYQRYLVGNEAGLEAYYTFDYSVANQFYDLSYTGTKYHMNHGTVENATLSDAEIPTPQQLAYKNYTSNDGSYTLRALPYAGNGTTYMIIPRLGIHQFESERELRLVSEQSQSHTVNFTDKSSFAVSGKVVYKGGTVPVEGVSFAVDGVSAMNGKGQVITTAADGTFTINVPVGQHEVKAVLTNHKFVNDGRITDSELNDRNYQDMLTGIELFDETTVRYIGRVAGGTVQEEYAVGHSLSKNNLADSIKVTLTYQSEQYTLHNEHSDTTMSHFKPAYLDKAKTNEVVYEDNKIVITPNAETGEFIADLYPVSYTVRLTIPGYETNDISGNGEPISLTNVFNEQYSVNEYVDSVSTPGSYINRADTLVYNQQSKFIKRVKPSIIVNEIVNGTPVDYFGKEKIKVNTLAAENSFEGVVYDPQTKAYTFDMPVYEQGQIVTYGITTAEIYDYMDADGKKKADVAPDKVSVPEATLKIDNATLPFEKPEEDLTTDENGYAELTFQVNNPELTSGIREMSMTMTYGEGESNTSIDWEGFKALVIGGRTLGTDFITAGPDNLLFVLRDPPGSNSYSYLEKGVTVTQTSTYNSGVSNIGSETTHTALGIKLISFIGIGSGTILESDIIDENKFGITHSEMIGSTNTDIRETTTTTRFSTSEDPLYVGTNGDLYVGYSTNVGIGRTENITLVQKDTYDKNPDQYELYDNITDEDADLLVVKTTGLGLSQSYNTLFAYPQVHIENVLIPNIEDTRNKLLHLESEDINFQDLAEATNSAVYVSLLDPDDDNFGKSNTDPIFGSTNTDVFSGPSYQIFFPKNTELQVDTIAALNQSIANWEKQIAKNEEQKVKAERMENISFQAGTSYEYTEEYISTRSETRSFSISIGGTFTHQFGYTTGGGGLNIWVDESIETENGEEHTTDVTGRHAQGFVLAEAGDDDYISVDVCRETGFNNGDQYISYADIASNNATFPTFIFKTRGGATSCPYEGADSTRYFEPNMHLLNEPTIQIEVPEISVEKSFIENVPSGKPAYFTLYLRNNSESQEDGWFNLVIDEQSNPYGAQMFIDGTPIGNGRAFLVPAGETLVKTLEVRKGTVMNYDNLRLMLQSQCQCDFTTFIDPIFDDVVFSAHFTPSATDVNLKSPANNWIYNTKLPTADVNGLQKHYMEVTLDGFDVNYDNFNRVMLQYKPSANSDDNWITLMSYYNDSTTYDRAIANGQQAEMIKAEDAGTIKYRLFIDDLPDQRYDLRAVGTSIINNVEIFNHSTVHSGIKDMYNPRLFGSAQPANGVLTVDNEIRLNFNEQIADGLLTDNNFEVTGIRNGAQGDHSVSVSLDGQNDVLTTEFNRNWQGKSLTVEMWILADKAQDAVVFSQGNVNSAIELGITADNRLRVKVGADEVVSKNSFNFEQGTWAHIAMTYDGEGSVCAYYNYEELISNAATNGYDGEGAYAFGASINGGSHFAGKMHNARIWDKVCPGSRLQTNSLAMLTGSESNLIAYYPMTEARGSMITDKARGANLEMNGGNWVVPEGRAVAFDGTNYLKVSSGSTCVIESVMDYTIELWFKAAEDQQNATIVSNGRGDGNEYNHSLHNFSLGFDDGVLTFANNGIKAACTGNYLDNNWHHVAVAVNRTSGRAQIYIDGKLNTFFEANDLGGVESAYIYLGVRAWNPVTTTSTLETDNFFKGEIDEFRVWELYKSESLIAEGMGSQLDGTEKGLMAYYPFEEYNEWQGIQELKFTLKDAKVQRDPAIVVDSAEVVGNSASVATTVSAPVAAKGPVSKLLYDFVVNDDALIIELKEPYDRIEKTIVNFTVDGVRDVNGNEILSPITWSAYIDRNQLKWTDTSVSINKQLNEEKTFSVGANNRGGSIQHYTIENMPSWLDVKPSSGTIDPVSTIDVFFTIDPSLNIGTYDEVVYLRNDNNVVEALPITVKVEGEKPDWSVDPSKYQYNMSVFGKLLIDNIYSADEEDILAAFDGNECVGVCTNKYYKVNDMYYAMLTIYSNQAQVTDKEVEFRIWDASSGKTYVAIPGSPIYFANNSVVGSPSNPEIFTAKDLRVQQIGLNNGWNWISVNVENSNLGNITALLANNSWTTDDQLKHEEQGFVSYSRKGWVGTLTGIDNSTMYMLRSSRPQQLNISGTPVDTRANKLTIRGSQADNTPRWSYISYLPADNMTLKEALAGYEATEGDIVKSQTSMAMYDKNMGWIGSLGYMESGKGYMLQRQGSDDVTLQYPSKSSVGKRNVRARATEEVEQATAEYGYRFATNMTAVARVEGIEATEGDRLVAYVNGDRRGEAEATVMADGSILFLMTISGEGSEQIDIALERNGEQEATAKSVVTYGAHATHGTLNSPLVVRFTDVASGVAVYPTPFSTQLTIRATVDDSDKVDVNVINVKGVQVAAWPDCNANGDVHVIWDVDPYLPAGVYIVNVVINGKIESINTLKK